ncbi:unnamed protein product [Angiostrongylus costaricensis]|uniref:G_PROTEIN_RECEP_F1_2 domain-containing protein n=1 Tax=Angiostrongylus costaricensis TaxID=334426 RepID=A0A158PEM2_ANGCS|nr:unnamed protein product [Angiostrongylus costaricensis]
MRLITEAHMDNVQALNVERVESEILTSEFDYSEWLNNASVSSHGYFRKTSLLFYFIALSTCNALQLLLSIFVIVLPAMEQFIGLEFPRKAENLHRMNAITVRLGYPLMLAANYAAIWLLTLICAQRFQVLVDPYHFNYRCDLSSIESVEIAIDLYPKNDDLLYKVIQEGIVYGLIVYGLPICLLLWLNLNIIRLIRGEQLHVQASRRPAEYRTALMTVCVFVFFFLCTTLSASIRLFMISAGGLVDAQELVWLVDLSNLLMNINALVTPIICFICTRGFKDLFFVIRFAPPKGSIDEKDFNRHFTPMLSPEGGATLKCSLFAL